MARYVIDASAALAFVLREGNSEADMFWFGLNPDDELTGAQILVPECTSVIREHVYYSQITREEGEGALSDLLAFRIRVNLDERQFSRSLELAAQSRRVKAYDMQYLAVAELEGLELVTADNGLRQAATNIKHPVRFLR